MNLGAVSTAVVELYAALAAPATAPLGGSSGPAGTLDADTLLSTIEQAQQVVNICGGIQAHAMAHLAAHEEVRDVEQASGWSWKRHGLGFVADDTASLVADRLGVSVPVAANRVEDAVHQVTVTPRLVDAMGSGALDQFRAHLVTREVRDCDEETAATIVERLVTRAAEPAPWKAAEDAAADQQACPSRGWDETAGPLASRTRRLVTRHAPDVAAARKKQAVKDRCLTRRALSDTADQWHGLVPVEQSLVMWQAVDHLARTLHSADPTLTLDQARVDALQQLILGQADVTLHLHATHPAEAPTTARADAPLGSAQGPRTGLVGRGSDAAVRPGGVIELAGLGRPGTTTIALDRLPAGVRLTDSTTLTCHPDTGALLSGDVPKSLAPTARRIPTDAPTEATATGDKAEERYRPSPALQRLVRLRDGHCRFPGCRVPARSCDLDHVTAWPTGPTTATNLICLCRRHHRVKQRPGWTTRLDPDGVVHWTDPAGRRTTTAPVDHLDRVLHLERDLPRGRDLPIGHSDGLGQPEPTGDTDRVAPSPPSEALATLMSSEPASPQRLDSLAELALARLLELASVPIVSEEQPHATRLPAGTGRVECHFGPWHAAVEVSTMPPEAPRPNPPPPPF